MAVFTVWNGVNPAGFSTVSAGARTDGIQFTVSSTCQLTGFGFFLPTGGTASGASYTGYLWSTTTGSTGTLLGSQVGSGTWTSNAWNWITLSSPITLSPGVTYVLGVSSPDWIAFVHNYYNTGGPGVGGFTSGPISVPDAAGALGGLQQPFVSAAGTFPNTVSTNSWYGVDIQVTTTGGTGATVTGVTANVALAAPAGSVSAGATVQGVTAHLSLSAPPGSVGSLVLPALDPFQLEGDITAPELGGFVAGENIEDITGEGYGGSME